MKDLARVIQFYGSVIVSRFVFCAVAYILLILCILYSLENYMAK